MGERIGALSVISGGLDSILATRVMMDQGTVVTAIHFATPFFGSLPGRDGDAFCERMKEKFGITAISVDITEKYIAMLSSPSYGYGKNFNPCVDCKILLLAAAREMMDDFNAKFIITGEVLGQRPMSQRRDAMRVIERDSGTSGILLRPLSAKLFKPTVPEEKEWVNRDELFSFSGRSRKPQIELAARLGITGYPAPAGGCCLTDPIQAVRIRKLYTMREHPDRREAKLIQIGRPFLLGDGTILSVGRNEEENETIEGLALEGDLFFKLVDIPGPLGLLVGNSDQEMRRRAMAIVAYFSKARDLSTVRVGMGKAPDSFETVWDVTPAGQNEIVQTRF